MIIVVICGTVFTMVVLDDDDDDKLDIDVVRNDLAVGDYIKYNSDGIGELNITADMTHTESERNILDRRYSSRCLHRRMDL